MPDYTPEQLQNLWPQFCQAEAYNKALDISGVTGSAVALDVDYNISQFEQIMLELGLEDTLIIPSYVPKLRKPYLEKLQVVSQVVVFDNARQIKWDREDKTKHPVKLDWMCDIGLIIPQYGHDASGVLVNSNHAITLHATSGVEMPSIGSTVTVESHGRYITEEDFVVTDNTEFSAESTLGFLSLMAEIAATAEN